MKLKMDRKSMVQMLVVLSITLIFLLFLFGWLPIKEKDNPRIIAESEHWQLSSRLEEYYTPSFLYSGRGYVDGDIEVCGVGFYEDSSGVLKARGISEDAEVHNYINGVIGGEDNWALEDIGDIQAFQSACCRITWHEVNKDDVFTEYIISDTLTEEQINQVKNNWIEGDNQDFDNPI